MSGHITIDTALSHLRSSHTLLYPTDTIWGIGCDATSEAAVQRIIEIKGRSEDKSFILLVNGLEMLELYVEAIPDHAARVMQNQDGPLTIIYPNGKNLAPQIVAKNGSVAIRITADPFCQELITQFGKPIVSSSANKSGEPAPLRFVDIDPEIKAAVDHIVPLQQDEKAPTKASTIIKLGLHGEIDIIRR